MIEVKAKTGNKGKLTSGLTDKSSLSKSWCTPDWRNRPFCTELIDPFQLSDNASSISVAHFILKLLDSGARTKGYDPSQNDLIINDNGIISDDEIIPRE